MDGNTGNLPGSCDEKKKRKRRKRLQAEIRQQIEFYFSDANLRKDRFLKQEIDKSEDRYIHISTIAAFNRIQKMTTDQALIAKALEQSEHLEVSKDKSQLRRKKPMEEPRYNIDDVTVFVEHLPHNVDHDMLRKAFSICGNIAYISLPRYKTTGDPKKFAFIEFSTPEEAAKACKLLNNPPRDKPSADGHFPTTRKGRLILPEQPVDANRLPESGETKERGKERVTKRKRDVSETEETSSDAEREKMPKKKKGVAKKGDSSVDGDNKVMLASKRKQEAGGAPDASEHRVQLDKKAKKKKEAGLEAETKNDRRSVLRGEKKDGDKHDGLKDKNERKRKHSGGEDIVHERSHRGERSDTRARGERSDTGAKVERSDTGDKGERSDTGVKGERSDTGVKGERSDTGVKGERSAKGKKKANGLETHKRKREDSSGSIESSKVKRASSGHGDKEGDGMEVKRKRAESEVMEEGQDGDKKRKRKSRCRKQKKEEGDVVTTMQLRVIPKKEWLTLREEYLAMQKVSRQQMKQTLREQWEKGKKSMKRQEGCIQKEPTVQPQVADVKLKSTEPEYVPGVVLEIRSDKPFASRKDLREQLQGISPVAYIELNDGDQSGFVRLMSAEGAKAVLEKASKISNDSGNVLLNLLSGQDEQQYWEKLRAERITKLSTKKRKQKKRGTNRILNKSEKVLGTSKTKKSHIQFDSDG